MGRIWTKEQADAINIHGANLLVAAAAGSGKTAVLVERIIQMIINEDSPTDIDKLLVVTFTNAAAAEMRERIGKALAEKISEKPNSEHLQRQLVLLNKSSITTIHSFCQNIIRNNFHKINIDPGFRVGDSTEIELLLMETLDEIMEERYKEENLTLGFTRLVEGYGKNEDDSSIHEIILKLYRFIMAMPWPKKFLQTTVDYYKGFEKASFEDSDIAKSICQVVYDSINPYIAALNNLIEKIQEEDINYPHLSYLIEERQYLEEILESSKKGYLDTKEAIEAVQFNKFTNKKTTVSKETKESIKDLRVDYKEDINKLIENYFYDNISSINEEFKFLAPIIETISDVAIELIDKFKDRKKARGIIDFNDMEHYALELLCSLDKNDNIIPSDTALELRRKYEEIMIDEYQDSSFIQEAIMTVISRKDSPVPNMFMVGDVKQSIYKFRQAKPELFLKKYNSFSKEEAALDKKILLYKNFRSRKEILDGINYIFYQIMSEELGELEYTEKEALNLGAKYPEIEEDSLTFKEPIEVVVFEKDGEEKNNKDSDTHEDDSEEDLTALQLEARLIGKEIIKLMGRLPGNRRKKVFDSDNNEYRNLEYKDIVILLRSTLNRSDVILEELKNLDVPVYADSSSGYFDNIEVQTIMSLLQIIDNPNQDIPFISVLRSPIGGFSAEDLINLRLNSDNGYYYDKLKAYVSQGEEEELRAKARDFIMRLDDYRDRALHYSLVELIWFLFTDTGYLGFVSAMVNGEQRQGNLKILFQRAKQYENTSYRGLYNFINFMEKMKRSSGDLGDAKLLGENDNVVRIMTIHKSKGLEFPVVFLSNASKEFNNRDLNSDVLLHHNLGIGLKYIDFEKRISYSSILRNIIRDKMKIENYSEEMRVLYVALTRAKEKLFIIGGVRNLEKAAIKWSKAAEIEEEKLPKELIIRGNSYLDWIGYSLFRHRAGSSIREISNIKDTSIIKPSPSSWNVSLLSYKEITGLKSSTALEEERRNRKELYEEVIEQLSNGEESSLKKEVERRLSFKYQYSKFTEVPSLLSVSEIKRRFTFGSEGSREIYVPKLLKEPNFLQGERELTSAERGTAVHTVMQHIDLNSAITLDSIKVQISDMIDKELLSEKEAKTVNPYKILRFLSSKIGVRMIKSQRIYREYPFKIRVNSREIMDGDIDGIEDEYILVQGVIDTFFEEDDGIVIIDYKNDYVNDNIIKNVKSQYEIQLKYYKKAVEKLMDKKVKNVYLYLFYSSEVLEYDL